MVPVGRQDVTNLSLPNDGGSSNLKLAPSSWDWSAAFAFCSLLNNTLTLKKSAQCLGGWWNLFSRFPRFMNVELAFCHYINCIDKQFSNMKRGQWTLKKKKNNNFYYVCLCGSVCVCVCPCLSVCVEGGHTHAPTCLWRSENNWGKVASLSPQYTVRMGT